MIHSSFAQHAAALALLSAFAAPTAAQVPGPMQGLPGNDTLGAAAGLQEAPSIARGGDSYLVAWADLRTDFLSAGITVPFQNAFDVYAARLDASGQLLDETPIVIDGDYGGQTRPQVAWNGENWLVAWVSRRLNPAGTADSDRVFATRVAPDGTVLDDPAIEVAVYPWGETSFVGLTSNGGDWLVLAQGTLAGEGGIVGARVAADGSLLDPSPVVLVPEAFYLHFDIQAVSAQGEYLLTYDGQGYKARRFQADLTPIGAAFATRGSQVGSNGASYYTVWTSAGSLVGSPMALNGTLSIPAGAQLASPAHYSLVEVDWDGAHWWTSVFNTAQGVIFVRSQPNGSVLDPGGVPYDSGLGDVMSYQVADALPGGGLMMAWTDSRLDGLNEEDVFAAPISGQIVPGPETVVSAGAPAQRFPDLAAGPGEHMCVFLSVTSGGRRVLAQRLDASGTALELEPRELDSGPQLGRQAFAVDLRGPRVAWNGSLYLVVWSNDGEVFAQRLAPDGLPVDPAPFYVTDGYAPDVEALGDHFLLVGTHRTQAEHWIQPFRMRIDGATGALLDSTPLDIDLYFARHPSVTTFDGRWLATWQRNGSHDDPACNVRAAFIDADGTPSPSFFVSFAAGRPEVATTDQLALFVFRSGNDTSSQPYVSAARMTPAGTLLDGNGFVVASAGNGQTHPRVTRTGAGFTAAWEDMRNAEAFFDRRTDVYARRFTPDGALLDAAPFPVQASRAPSESPVLSSLGGPALLAASVYRSEAPHAAFRTETTVIAEGDPIALYCYGSVCPCGNDDGGAGCANSSGSGALLETVGTTRVGLDDLELHATGLLPGQPSLLFAGASAINGGNGAPFGDGLRCAGTRVVRLGTRVPDASGSTSWGPGLMSQLGLAVGDRRFFQGWYRDPAGPCGIGFNLTQGVDLIGTP